VKKKNRRKLLGAPITGKPVSECGDLDDIFTHCLPAFGGAYLQKFYQILRKVLVQQIPLVITVAGPITVSDQHRAWLIPLLRLGGVAYLTVTDAICYHDGHDALKKFAKRPIKEVDLYGDDAKLRQNGIVRVTNTAFYEKILFDQDRMISAILQQPEFQKPMTTTERNYLLGKYYEDQEIKFAVQPGLLSTCCKLDIPVFVGAAADGSAFLNSVKLWALKQLGLKSYDFSYDLHADIFEACAYHYWGLFNSPAKALAILILGGGVPKNYSLQPEPTLSQIFLLNNIRGYDFDVQIVSAPVTDGSLSSCHPSEAVSWGKVNPVTFEDATQSLQMDYSTIMPFVVKALTNKIKPRESLRLYSKREQLTSQLLKVIEKNAEKIKKTLDFPLQLLTRRVE